MYALSSLARPSALRAIFRSPVGSLAVQRAKMSSSPIRAIYSPKEHGGLKEDGTPDGRVKQDGAGEADSAPASTSSTPSGGAHIRKDGQPDKRFKDEGSPKAIKGKAGKASPTKLDGSPDKRFKGNKAE